MMTGTKAKDLSRGDELRMHVMCEVLSVQNIGGRVKVKISLTDQAQLEFTDQGCVAEFICKPGKTFQVYGNDDGWDGDDDGDGNGPVPIDQLAVA